MAKAKAKTGRPLADVDPDLVQSLAALQCSYAEIASVVGCSVATLTARFQQVIKQGRAEFATSLKRRQFQTAMGTPAVYDADGNLVQPYEKPNPTMQIFLGKVHLGMVEQQYINVDHSGGVTHTHEDVRAELESRIAGIAARIGTDEVAEELN